MRLIRVSGTALFALMALLAGGCDMLGDITGGDLPGPGETAYASNVVVVDDDITGSVTWDPSKVYYLGDAISVGNGASLTIPAGTIVKFGPYGNLTVDYGANLYAGMLGEAPVVFTSYRDTRGGDSITNDSSLPPAKGDWRFIWLIGDGMLRNCEFAYGASQTNDAVLEIDGDATVDTCVFHDNKGGNPISGGFAALDASDADSSASIANCIFYSNDWPLALHPGLDIDDSNVFEYDPDGAGMQPVLRNTHQAVFLAGGSISGSVSWQVTRVPYVSNEEYGIYLGASLAVANGAIVKFVAGNNCGINIDNGSGFSYSTAIFTEYRDDAHGGDTNADGNATSPSAYSWEGIYDDGAYIADADNIFFARNGVMP